MFYGSLERIRNKSNDAFISVPIITGNGGPASGCLQIYDGDAFQLKGWVN